MGSLDLAVVGTDSTHVPEALRLLRQEARIEGVTVRRTVDRLDDTALDDVDAVLVLHRHGRDHPPAGLAAIARGLPVFVDKPLAGGGADAAMILDRGRERGVPVTTRSALRFSPDVDGLRRLDGDLTVRGPADLDGGPEELLFYGIHVAELAHELAGPLELVDVHRVADRVVARCAADGRAVTLELLDRRGPGRTGFSVNEHPVGLDDDYLLPVLEHAVAVFRGQPPPPYADLLAPLLLVELIAHRLSPPGSRPVGT